MQIKTTGLSILIMLISMVSISNLASAQEASTLSYVKVEVDGLSCPFCAYGLEKKMKKIKGAKDIFISVDDAYTTFNVPKENPLSEDELKKVVKDAGFTARKITFSEIPFAKNEE